MATELSNEALGSKIDDLVSSANNLVQGLPESPSPEDVKAIQEQHKTLQAEVQPLLAERERRLSQESIKSLTGQVANLGSTVKQLQDAYRMPEFGSVEALKNDTIRYQGGKVSLYGDIAKASRGGKAGIAALERLQEEVGGKAFTEGDEAGGGYLVKPKDMGLLPAKVRPNVLYDLMPKVNVRTDKVEFASITNGLLAGWAAELAAKPLGDGMSHTLLEASIFTVAGLAVTSNQLLEDSSIDAYITSELEKRVQGVIEGAILTGTGTGQPRGLLNQTGVNDINWTDASPTVAELLVQIALAVAAVQDNNLSEPTHILLSPTTWTKIITSADAQGVFTFGPGQSDPGNRTAADSFPSRSLFGVPVVLTGSMPRNLATDGTATGDQTRVVVLDASEQMLLIRSEMAVDRSEHVYFTSNQTVFRGERRVGFTAARYPKSISVVRGTGMTTTVF